MYEIQNSVLSVKVKNAGAELSSIYNKKTGLEYLWQAGAEWPKQAPVLFPFVGQLKNNTFIFEGKTYPADRHGFARTKLFEAADQAQDKIIFILQDDAGTIKDYPFKFKLTVAYSLKNSRLDTSYCVENKGTECMYFSIGAHPAFRVPLEPNLNYTDYFLDFEKKENAVKYCLNNGILDGTTKPALTGEDRLMLTRLLFYQDALVFKDLRSERITIRSIKSSHGLHFTFSGFPFFGIWAARDADFVCLEPWYGIADSISHNQKIEMKEGIISLRPSESFSCGFGIDTF